MFYQINVYISNKVTQLQISIFGRSLNKSIANSIDFTAPKFKNEKIKTLESSNASLEGTEYILKHAYRASFLMREIGLAGAIEGTKLAKPDVKVIRPVYAFLEVSSSVPNRKPNNLSFSMSSKENQYVDIVSNAISLCGDKASLNNNELSRQAKDPILHNLLVNSTESNLALAKETR